MATIRVARLNLSLGLNTAPALSCRTDEIYRDPPLEAERAKLQYESRQIIGSSTLLAIPAKAAMKNCVSSLHDNPGRIGHSLMPDTTDTVTVAGEDGAVRLDRWFKRHYPALG